VRKFYRKWFTCYCKQIKLFVCNDLFSYYSKTLIIFVLIFINYCIILSVQLP
jgi:hypothetical protein